MTIFAIEDVLPDSDEHLASQDNQMVKCSWCGEIIRVDGNELALAVCQACYDTMLAEFLRSQQTNQLPSRPSDR